MFVFTLTNLEVFVSLITVGMNWSILIIEPSELRLGLPLSSALELNSLHCVHSNVSRRRGYNDLRSYKTRINKKQIILLLFVV